MQNALPDQALFELLDERVTPEGASLDVRPTAFTGGPWSAKHQHGGAVSALMTRALEAVPTPVQMRLTRISLDMFRGVPLEDLRVETRIMRSGLRIQAIEARLLHGTHPVAHATGLRLRRDESLAELEARPTNEPEIAEPPSEVPPFEMRSGFGEIPGFVRACDLIPGRAQACGEVTTTWARLRCAVLSGEVPSATVRLAAVADFASGTGNAMDYTAYSSINPDLSIHILSEPRSDWIAIRGVTTRAADGIGQGHAIAHDLIGPVARISATMLLDRR